MYPKFSLLLLPLGAALALNACASLPDFHAENPPEYDRLAQITPGLSQADVSDLAGRPQNVTGSSGNPDSLWIYSYSDEWGYPSEFDVSFDSAGKVSGTYSERIK
jgi:hypothetical protein